MTKLVNSSTICYISDVSQNNTRKGDYEMGEKIFFEIPDDVETILKLVESIPSTWSWLDGWLDAPKRLTSSGAAVENTGFRISRFHSIKPTVIGRHNRDGEINPAPDLFEILVEQKLPGFIEFDEAGFGRDILDHAKSLAAGFLSKGYEGRLDFYMDYDQHRDSKYSNPARCNMIFRPWNGPGLIDEHGPQPARVKLEWDEKYGGKMEDIWPIADVCRNLGLKEYKPEVQEEASVSR